MAPGPQLGTGGAAIEKNGNVIGYIASYYTASGFREVIVAKAGKLSRVPIPLDTYDLVGQQIAHQSTPKAQATALEGMLGGSSFDYWWVDSGAAVLTASNGNPPAGYSYEQSCEAKDNGVSTSVWSQFTKTISATEVSTWVPIGRPSGSAGPDIVPEDCTFSDVTPGTAPTTGAALDTFVSGFISPFEVYTITESVEELSSKNKYPKNW